MSHFPRGKQRLHAKPTQTSRPFPEPQRGHIARKELPQLRRELSSPEGCHALAKNSSRPMLMYVDYGLELHEALIRRFRGCPDRARSGADISSESTGGAVLTVRAPWRNHAFVMLICLLAIFSSNYRFFHPSISSSPSVLCPPRKLPAPPLLRPEHGGNDSRAEILATTVAWPTSPRCRPGTTLPPGWCLL